MNESMSNAFGGSVVAHVLFDAVGFGDEGAFEDDAALFVALVLLGGKLVDPAELDVALLLRHVAHHVAARQHHAVLHLAATFPNQQTLLNWLPKLLLTFLVSKQMQQ